MAYKDQNEKNSYQAKVDSAAATRDQAQIAAAKKAQADAAARPTSAALPLQ